MRIRPEPIRILYFFEVSPQKACLTCAKSGIVPEMLSNTSYFCHESLANSVCRLRGRRYNPHRGLSSRGDLGTIEKNHMQSRFMFHDSCFFCSACDTFLRYYKLNRLEFLNNETKLVIHVWEIPTDQWNALPNQYRYCESIVNEAKKTDTIRKQNRDRYRTLLIIFAIPALILNSVYIFKCLSDVNVGFWALAPLSALPEVFSCRKLLRHFTITALPQSVIRTREFSYCSRGVSHLQQKKNANHT